MTRKSFVSGALILMLAGLVVRVFGFIYRIYLSNLIGAEGMGLFQLISPVYSLIILTLTSGISIAVSKMVAEEAAVKRYANIRRITGCALAIVVSAGLAVSLLAFLELDFIVGTILKDQRTYYSMLLLIPCIPVIAAASALKGYYYGLQDVVPTAFSQIAEQVVKIGLVMLTAGYFLKLGLEYACALATVGMALGEIANLTVLYIVYAVKKRRKPEKRQKQGVRRKRAVIKELLKVAIPISSNRFVTSVMSAVEYILIPRMLVAGGLDYTSSMELFGKLSGMVLPLIYFPSLVTSSLATTLVPAISEAVSLKNFRSVNYRISKSIQISFILGFVFMALFLSYPDHIGNLLYRREKIGDLLYSLSFTCVLVYLSQTLMGILNGLGRQTVLLRNSIIGSAIRIGFVYFAVPGYGINGYIWGFTLSLACVCCLNLHVAAKATGLTLDFRNWLIKPGLVCAFMVFAGRYIYYFFTILTSQQTLLTLLTLSGSAAAALALMFAAGVLKAEEVKRMLGTKRKGN